MARNSVFVVMGNDYPDAVFTTEEAAEKYCDKQRAAIKARQTTRTTGTHIYWRVYEFTLNKEGRL